MVCHTPVMQVSGADIKTALDNMILSASGWRGIFSCCGDEEGREDRISAAHRVIAGGAARVFADYLHKVRKISNNLHEKTVVLIGSDTRPTGKAIARAMIPVLQTAGCEVKYCGFTAAPEIMAWAGSGICKETAGFIYISASHNPIGYNGFKFGLTDGGVLSAEEAVKLIYDFRHFMDKDHNLYIIKNILLTAAGEQPENLYLDTHVAKEEAYKAYYNFCAEVVWAGNSALACAFKKSLLKQPAGIVCDFNGSARCVSIDRDFFSAGGLLFKSINDKPGEIVHRIVPEGESLEPCRELLEKAHKENSSFVLGYLPDCDGDRGNPVIWDDKQNRARILEAQEVFALACVAELSHLVWTGELTYDDAGKLLNKAAVVINDPTSMRVDHIARAFGVSVFRAEVGEANVVGLARRLRKEGYIVRILGEGAAGGNITHPSAVRDPMHTIFAVLKLLLITAPSPAPGSGGFFQIWCRLSGQADKYRDDFTLTDITASLPKFTSTSTYSEDAILRINTPDHAVLKDRYQKIFLREWEIQKNELKKRFSIHSWQAMMYNGMEEKRPTERFGEAGRGGLKIIFYDGEGQANAYIWMRGSATEPVFRIMADSEDITGREDMEWFLLDWQRRMITEADNLL